MSQGFRGVDIQPNMDLPEVEINKMHFFSLGKEATETRADKINFISSLVMFAWWYPLNQSAKIHLLNLSEHQVYINAIDWFSHMCSTYTMYNSLLHNYTTVCSPCSPL